MSKEVVLKEIQEAINKINASVSQLLIDECVKMEDEKEPEKKEFVTVTDGWRGSLKLKECWVKDYKHNDDWERIENIELIARHESEYDGDKFAYISKHNRVCFAKELKFRPFSPENPPPVDWPVGVDGSKIRYAVGRYSNNGIIVYDSGRTSLTGWGALSTSSYLNYEFQNIEPVED